MDATDPGDLRSRARRDVRQSGPDGPGAQPDEIAPSYVFFAAGQLSSYYSGEVLAPVGGETLPGA
jgi:hypothetical protein